MAAEAPRALLSLLVETEEIDRVTEAVVIGTEERLRADAESAFPKALPAEIHAQMGENKTW